MEQCPYYWRYLWEFVDGTWKKCLLSGLKGARIKGVEFRDKLTVFARDKENCPLQRSVPFKRVSPKLSLTVRVQLFSSIIYPVQGFSVSNVWSLHPKLVNSNCHSVLVIISTFVILNHHSRFDWFFFIVTSETTIVWRGGPERTNPWSSARRLSSSETTQP